MPLAIHLASRSFAIVCAIAAAVLGLASLWLAGAPTSYLIVNAGAVVGGAMVAGAGVAIARIAPKGSAGVLIAALGAAMLAVALLGDGIDGVARWISAGSFRIQPTLIAAPVMLVLFARHRDRVGLLGMVLLSVALALQSDRGLSAAMVAGLAAMMAMRRDHGGLAALVPAILAFAAAMMNPDTLQPVRHVELVLVQAFEASVWAGLAAWAGALLLIAPGIANWRSAPHAAFAALWGAMLVAATLGFLPTPVIGYGASAIVGYLLSLAALSPPKAEAVA